MPVSRQQELENMVKGFSVVAEEVGNLAAMSGKSAIEITEMLNSSLAEVKNIVNNSKESINKLTAEALLRAEYGVNKSYECAKVFEDIHQNFIEMDKSVESIVRATKEQTLGVEQISEGVRHVDCLAKENSEIASETLDASKNVALESKDLSIISQELNEILEGDVTTVKEKSSLSLVSSPDKVKVDLFS